MPDQSRSHRIVQNVITMFLKIVLIQNQMLRKTRLPKFDLRTHMFPNLK